MAESSWVIDVDEETFSTEVLERSKSIPVLVDFWAPWCGPCRTLGPRLEKLAEEKAGDLILAKINADDNPNLSQTHKVRGIPAVKLFVNGQVVDEFTGALPESAIRKFLEKNTPSEADELAKKAGELATAGHLQQAESLYEQALQRDPGHYQGILGLSWVRMKSGRLDDARKIFSHLTGKAAASEGAKILRAQLAFAGDGNDDDLEPLEARLAVDPSDLETRLALARALIGRERYEQGLDQLLEIVRRDRGFQDDAGRKGVLQVFDLLGPKHPLVPTYRSKLSAVLFS